MKHGYQNCVSNNHNVRSGLVCLSANVKYITLHVEGKSIDQSLQGDQTHNGGETAKNDDQAAVIDSFATAAPLLAGIYALVKQAYLILSSIPVRDILTRTAPSVTWGKRIASREIRSTCSAPGLAKGLVC